MSNLIKKSLSVIFALTMTVTCLAVPLSAQAYWQQCSACGGTGKTVCISCGGTGGSSVTMYNTDPFTGAFVPTYSWQVCTSCGGSGRQTCYSCFGTGGKNVDTPSGGGDSGSATTDEDGSSTTIVDDDGNELYSDIKNGGCIVEATKGVCDSEEANNLFDGDKKTKFNIYGDWGYVIWKAPKLIKVSGYSITTANDNATYKGRNPKMWALFGCNEPADQWSDKWQELDFVEKDTQLKNKNFTKYEYKISEKSKPYRYYLFRIKQNKGADCTQLSEFTLKGKTYSSKPTTLKSVKKKSKTSMVVKWNKQSKATGYQLQYSTSKKFKSAKKITIKKVKTTSKTVKKLKKGKTYYVRIRTFKTVNGQKVYSKWSKAKSVKLK